MSGPEVLAAVRSSEEGLATDEAAGRFARAGRNVLVGASRRSPLALFLAGRPAPRARACSRAGSACTCCGSAR
jgi:hypothetical protein